jgi:hypothetical protein
MTVLYILVSILASYIYILDYLLGHLPSKVNLLVLLCPFLGVLLLYFLPLLGLFRALRYLPPIVLTMLWLGFLLAELIFIPLTPTSGFFFWGWLLRFAANCGEPYDRGGRI